MDQERAVRQLQALQKLIRGKEMRLAAQGWDADWKILISTILSAVTRDEVTIAVCENDLFVKYPTLEALGRAKIEDVEEVIKSINFYRNKTRNIIGTAQALTGREIPTEVEELIKLPGVGRKVANVYLNSAHAANAIGVDTHVIRISNKLGWTKSKNADKIEQELETLFPKKYWSQINETLVTFGKSIGLSRRKEDEVLERVKEIV